MGRVLGKTNGIRGILDMLSKPSAMKNSQESMRVIVAKNPGNGKFTT